MEKQLFNYDETDIQSILDYSQHLLDRSLGEIIAEYQVSPYKTNLILMELKVQQLTSKMRTHLKLKV